MKTAVEIRNEKELKMILTLARRKNVEKITFSTRTKMIVENRKRRYENIPVIELHFKTEKIATNMWDLIKNSYNTCTLLCKVEK